MTKTKTGTAAASRPLPPWAAGGLGVAATIALWWLAAATVLAGVGAAADGTGGAVPTPDEVFRRLASDGVGFYWPNLAVTVAEASAGYLWGNLAALLLAGSVLVLPALERLVTQLAVISYCLPIVAIGPLAFIVIGSPARGQASGTAVLLAGISVFFTTVVGALSALKSADKASLDLVTVYGGGRFQQLIKVQLISALPGILNALKIAVPAAVLGAVLGEYVGGVDRGIGPALVNAQQNLEIARAWGVALVAGLLAGAGYGVLAVLARFVAPWSAGRQGTSR
ncbi:ABC transporter permease subunit [Arthrobacter sp. NicSoilB8]|uniref:ABC transporter permease n=1 Tax=Arthrobacter sp. NicSoilB8 TaxID=2830998 RepID=UPI001CC58E0E|nr:ABC transporter permease subunit [Arthrobacter sp. NicSoilB8]